MVKTFTYRELLEMAIRAEELILDRNELEVKKKKTTNRFTSPSFKTGEGSTFRGSSF